LPESDDIKRTFGQIHYNNSAQGVSGYHNYAQASVLYDVLNKVAIDRQIADAKAYEVDLAFKHWQYTQNDDLILVDRGYPSYRFLATLIKSNRQFVARCSAGSFKIARLILLCHPHKIPLPGCLN